MCVSYMKKKNRLLLGDSLVLTDRKVKNNKGHIFNPRNMDDMDELASLSERDIEESVAKRSVSIIDRNGLEKILKADDIIGEYNKYCDESAKRIVNLEKYDQTYIINALRNEMSDEVLVSEIRKYGYKNFSEDEKEMLKLFIEEKLILYDNLINSYIKILDHNYKTLKINVDEYEKMSKELRMGKNINDNTNTIIATLERNRHIWERPWGADFTKFGGGKVFINTTENMTDFDFDAKSLFNTSLRYDVTIICHGTDYGPSMILTEDELRFMKKYKSLLIKYNKAKFTPDELVEMTNELDENDLKILKRYSKDLKKLEKAYDITTDVDFSMYAFSQYPPEFRKCIIVMDILNGTLRKRWCFGRQLKTPYGDFKDVNDCLRACISHGNKKINILSCNPGHYELDDDILAMKDIIINYQYFSVWIESAFDIFKNIRNNIKRFDMFTKELTNNVNNLAKSMSKGFDKSIGITYIEFDKMNRLITSTKHYSDKSSVLKGYYENAKNINNNVMQIKSNIQLLHNCMREFR